MNRFDTVRKAMRDTRRLMATISENIHQVRARIAAACAAARRPVETITLLCVSKTMPQQAVREAFEAGERAFGENYVQEGVDKVIELAALRDAVQWHLVGPVQSNKTRLVAEHFDWVHSVDRVKIAERLSQQRPAHLKPLQVCLQVNVSGEASKSGLAPEEVLEAARQVSLLPRLVLRGLMSIPEPAADMAAQRAPHARLRGLLEELRGEGLAVDTLSMGMTADLEAAILEGSTIVRVGAAIFGSRVRPEG
jgi:pyridoxal phosphate enzyme (YggS family)